MKTVINVSKLASDFIKSEGEDNLDEFEHKLKAQDCFYVLEPLVAKGRIENGVYHVDIMLRSERLCMREPSISIPGISHLESN